MPMFNSNVNVRVLEGFGRWILLGNGAYSSVMRAFQLLISRFDCTASSLFGEELNLWMNF